MRCKYHKITIAMGFMAIVILFSCKKSIDKQTYSNTIDSLVSSLESEITLMKDVVLIPIAEKQDSVLAKINRIQNNYSGTMPAKTAALISEYNFVVKSIPNAEEKALDELRNLLLCKQQLIHLKQAVISDATHDALGNEISEPYMNAAIEQEKTSAEISIRSSQQLREKYVSMSNAYDRLTPSIDSLMLVIFNTKR